MNKKIQQTISMNAPSVSIRDYQQRRLTLQGVDQRAHEVDVWCLGETGLGYLVAAFWDKETDKIHFEPDLFVLLHISTRSVLSKQRIRGEMFAREALEEISLLCPDSWGEEGPTLLQKRMERIIMSTIAKAQVARYNEKIRSEEKKKRKRSSPGTTL